MSNDTRHDMSVNKANEHTFKRSTVLETFYIQMAKIFSWYFNVTSNY